LPKQVYDTDGNFLQALDTIEMQRMLPDFWTEIKNQAQQKGHQQCKLVDLGCGTGRNTLQLLDTVSRDAPKSNIQIIGVDASNGMLDVARQRIDTFQSPSNIEVKLAPFDLLTQTPSNVQTLDLIRDADGMISTLVLEHIPLDSFFKAAASVLRSGAYFLVTNMHSDMGKLSQAGFVDSATGKKVRPSRSFAHEIEYIVAEAERCGFEIVQLPSMITAGMEGCVEGVIEREVTPDMVERLGPRSQKYVGVCSVWLGVCFRKR
jgi:predicted TPR repeat methyltransferase